MDLDEECDIFISHSSVDKDEVYKIYEELKTLGLNVYYHQEDNTPGDYPTKLGKLLGRARCLVLYLSEHAAKSSVVKYEYNDFLRSTGANKEKKIMPYAEGLVSEAIFSSFLGLGGWVLYNDVEKLRKSIGEMYTETDRLRLKKSQVQADQAKLKIGIGCCLWAAPLIRTFFRRNGIENCAITLYGFKRKNGESENYWYNYKNIENVMPYILPFDGDSNLNANIRKWDDEMISRAKLFNASDLTRQVENKSLDCIIVPSEVFELEGNDKQLRKVASIMHTYQGGCKLLVVSKDPNFIKTFQAKIAELDFLDVVKEESESLSIGQVKVLLNRKTVLEKYYDQYFDPKPDESKSTDIFNIELGDWKSLITSLDEVMKLKEKFFLILAWEPQVSWIKKHLQNVYDIEPLDFDFLNTFKDFNLPYLSFDIMLSEHSLRKWRSENHLEEYFNALKQLFFNIEDSIKGFNTNRSSPRDIEDEAGKLSSFMWISKSECKKLLKVLNFKFMVYWNWVDKMETMLQEEVIRKLQEEIQQKRVRQNDNK